MRKQTVSKTHAQNIAIIFTGFFIFFINGSPILFLFLYLFIGIINRFYFFYATDYGNKIKFLWYNKIATIR